MKKNYVRIEAQQSLDGQGNGEAILSATRHKNRTVVISVDVPYGGSGILAQAQLTPEQVRQLAKVITPRRSIFDFLIK